MNEPINLELLWKTQPVNPAMKGDDMRDIILQRISNFERTIRIRNRVESVAALVVAAFFAYASWASRNGLQRLGSAIVAAGAMWIFYYIRSRGAEPAEPAPDQTAVAYGQALALKYEHQIRLLRNVKFWYLLPMYVGLLTGTAGILVEQAARGAIGWADAIDPLIYTSTFAAVWWLNEVYAVRKLLRCRSQVILDWKRTYTVD